MSSRSSADGPDSPHLGLLDSVLEARAGAGGSDPGLLGRFLAEESTGRAPKLWVGQHRQRSRDALARRIGRDIARIDSLISEQVDEIIHHPRFQKLEASWRGLRYLIDRPGAEEDIK